MLGPCPDWKVSRVSVDRPPWLGTGGNDHSVPGWIRCTSDQQTRRGAPCGARDGGYAAARGATGDQTDQESRSAGHRATTSLTGMNITVHSSFLLHDDPGAAVACCRDTLGFEGRNDAGYGGMRWITVGPANQPGTSKSGLHNRL